MEESPQEFGSDAKRLILIADADKLYGEALYSEYRNRGKIGQVIMKLSSRKLREYIDYREEELHPNNVIPFRPRKN
jgi:hypothetical protein